MTEVLWETLGFLVKAMIVLATVAACAAVVAYWARAMRGGGVAEGRLQIKRLDDKLRALGDAVRGAVLPRKQAQQLMKARKVERKGDKKLVVRKPSVFVLDFHGDIMASAVESLREEVTALLAAVQEGDEVVLRLESGGGVAHEYGFAASQLVRLRSANIPLVVCVDRVAASGGYMMACVAQQILAAPFAIIGSIGVAAALPNAHRLLDRFGVDFEHVTAGQYKRTVSYFAKIDEAGKQKLQEQVDEMHGLFKSFIREQRPTLDVEQVATGETWYGTRALELGLVNGLMTSDEYLVSKVDGANVYQLSYQRPRRVRERFVRGVAAIFARMFQRMQERARPHESGA
jgi:serine protease SohB